MKYFKAHPAYVATVHALGGFGLGVILARPAFATHPLRWGSVFIGLAIIGHVYAWVASRA